MAVPEKRILIVDDDRDFTEAIAELLQSNGFCAVKAYDGEQALLKARVHKPDLILMDIVMNERTEGLLAIREIRSSPELKRVPIFIMSAFCTQLPDIGIPEGGWMSHDAFFSKPVDTAALLDKIRKWVGLAA